MTASLDVRFATSRVGVLRRDDQDRFCFAYDPTWRRFPISLSLPISDAEYVGGPAHHFFSNLLPEGGARQAVCSRLGISVDNDFGLLQAIGGECAGALSLVDPTRPARDSDEYEYEQLTARQLRSLTVDGAAPLLVGRTTKRLSLAGAQDKVPVAELDGKLHLPIDGGPSTHILKLPNPRYPHLPANEAFVLGLATRLGLDVAKARLFTGTKPASLLVTRYDRIASDDPWPASRLHQEDLCQALARPPTQKYEAEGGPDLARIVTVVRDHVVGPAVDVPRLIRWQAFNVVAGNSDGHAKNLSILYADSGARLAPFYDLLSTRQYKNLDRKLAMTVAGHRDPDTLSREAWTSFATAIGVGAAVVRGFVTDVAERTLELLAPWRREFAEENGTQAILQTLPAAISRRARRVLASMG